jgi:hypothetical protein
MTPCDAWLVIYETTFFPGDQPRAADVGCAQALGDAVQENQAFAFFWREGFEDDVDVRRAAVVTQ